MKAVFKLMMFSIVLNLAVGILSNIIPDITNNPQFNPLEYDEEAVREFNRTLDPDFKPGGDLEDKGNEFDRLLDSIGIGAVQRVLNSINTYLFGFVILIERVFKLGSWFSIFLRIMISIGYAMGAFWLWTGKNIGKG